MGMGQRAAPRGVGQEVALASGYQRYAAGLAAARLALWRAAKSVRHKPKSGPTCRKNIDSIR